LHDWRSVSDDEFTRLDVVTLSDDVTG